MIFLGPAIFAAEPHPAQLVVPPSPIGKNWRRDKFSLPRIEVLIKLCVIHSRLVHPSLSFSAWIRGRG